MNKPQNEDSKEDGSGAGLGRFAGHKALVFGGSGLIGKSLLSKIKCYSPSSRECDVRDFSAVDNLIKGYRPTVVINLAGVSDVAKCHSVESYEINVNAVTNICYAMAKHAKGSKLFQAGSINQILKPHDDYSIQKIKAAKIADSYSAILDVTNARLCTVEGDYRAGFIVSDMVRMVQQYKKGGSYFHLNDIGAQKWQCSASQMTDAIIKSVQEGATGTFYFGPTQSISIEDIFCEICRQLEVRVSKLNKSWMDVESGRVVMKGKLESKNHKPVNFGPPFAQNKIVTDLKEIVKTIILSS